MSRVLDAFWRAAAYCVHPRVVLLSLLPLALTAAVVFVLGWLFWEPAVAAVRATVDGWAGGSLLLQWLDGVAGPGWRDAVAPLVVVMLTVPLIVLLSLLLVAVLTMPAVVSLVAQRRFPALERCHGAGLLQSLAFSLGWTLLALLATLASLPFWLIPPLALLLPPLIWGWLSWRVFAFDALADHASTGERRELMRTHRWPLFAIGVVAGYLGALPSLLWAVSAVTLVLAPLLVLFSIWLYTLVFLFGALWFTHYALAALQALRAAALPPPLQDAVVVEPAPALPLPTSKP